MVPGLNSYVSRQFTQHIFFFFLRFYLLIFLEREREGEGREINMAVWLPLVRPLLGAWPTTQACVLDWELNK